jgi:hypothetical protein
MTLQAPFIGMLLLTMIVFVFMYIRRLSWLTSNNIDPQELTTPERVNNVIPEGVNKASNNLKNLFELPVVFYALCLYLMVTNQVNDTQVICANVFFVARAIHSIIHCTINKVMIRFMAYATAAIALCVMVVNAALTAI